MLKISLYQDYNVPLCRHIKTQNYRTYQSNTIYGQSKYSINTEDNTDIGTLISGMVSLTEKKASLNGNISSIIWRDSTQTASRGYRFTYDSMNRLTDAVYGEGPSLSENTDRYSERGMTYTKNGALTRLLRYGRRNTDDFGLIDSLVMTLDGNRVLSVEDGAGRLVYENSFDFRHTPPKPYEKPAVNRGSTYQYDGNGRLDYDPDKRVQLSYNLAGNPKRFECGSVLEYVYSSTGEKLCQFHNPLISVKKPPYLGTDTGLVNTTGTLQSILHENDYVRTYSFLLYDRDKKLSHLYCTDFNGPFIISRGILDKFLFDGGYCTFKDGQASFHYYLQDHLGNNRAVVSEAGTMEQITEYYPFGGIYGDVSTNPGLQLYKYNGKEFDHYLGLDLYDYGARLYDPALVVWTGVDPLADEYGGISPYAHCLSNPVKYIDPNGKKVVVWYRNKQGEYCQFIFTGFHGKNYIVYPRNQFVADFLQAYLYNVRNGGGDKMKEAVLNDKYKIYVDDAANLDESKTFFSPGRQPTIYWESRKGLKNSYGGKQSPATRLEHEFDHAIDNINNSHNHRIRREEADAQYDNKEEKRVITGSERKTARANKEDIRYNHKGKTFDVSGSTKVY